MNKLSIKSKELQNITGIDIRFWRILRDHNIVKSIKVGKSEIWLVEDVNKFLEWAKGRDLSTTPKLYAELAEWS